MNQAAPTPPDWIRPLTGEGAAPVAMICFPPAGGGIVGYAPWAKALRGRVDLHAASLPGREHRLREEPARSLEALVGPLAAAAARLADRPLVIFGHSFGALLAYEVAGRLLDHRLVAPASIHLVVSGRIAPHLAARAPRLSHLPPRDIVFRIADLHGNIPVALLEQPDFVAMIGRILQADLQINEAYLWPERAPLACPVTAVGGMSDPVVAQSELEAWGRHARAEFQCRLLPGDHFYFRTPAGQSALLDIITRCGEALPAPTDASAAVAG